MALKSDSKLVKASTFFLLDQKDFAVVILDTMCKQDRDMFMGWPIAVFP